MSLFMESIHAKITYDAEQALLHARRNKPLSGEKPLRFRTEEVVA